MQSGLSQGYHTVSFKSVSGWNTPSNKSVYIYANSTNSTSGVYSVISSNLIVTGYQASPSVGYKDATNFRFSAQVTGGSGNTVNVCLQFSDHPSECFPMTYNSSTQYFELTRPLSGLGKGRRYHYVAQQGNSVAKSGDYTVDVNFQCNNLNSINIIPLENWYTKVNNQNDVTAKYFTKDYGDFDPQKVKHIIIHHTGQNNDSYDKDWLDMANEVARQSNGYNKYKMPYNYLIAPDGRVYEGARNWGWSSDVLKGKVVCGDGTRFNAISVSIGLLGNYNTYQPTEQMLTSLKLMIAYLAGKYGIDVKGKQNAEYFIGRYRQGACTQVSCGVTKITSLDNVFGHKTITCKSCPGDNISSILSSIINEIQDCDGLSLTSNQLFISTRASLLSGARISIKRKNQGSFIFLNTTDENGNAKLLIYPEAQVDDLIKVEASGFETLSFAITKKMLEDGAITIPMLVASSPTQKVMYPSMKVQPSDQDSRGYQVTLSGKNVVKYQVLRGNQWEDISPNFLHQFSANTSRDDGVGNNYVLSTRLIGIQDTVQIDKLIPNYLDNNSHLLLVSSKEEYFGANIYINGAYYKTLTSSTETINLPVGRHQVDIIKDGYKIQSSRPFDGIRGGIGLVNVNLELLDKSNIANSGKSQVIELPHLNSIEVWNSITLQNRQSRMSKFILERRTKTYDHLGLVRASESFLFSKYETQNIVDINTSIVLNQAHSITLDSCFLVSLPSSGTIKKIYPEDFTTQGIHYEEIGQHLGIQSLRFDTPIEFVFCKRQKPIIKRTTFDLANTSKSITWDEIFDDPDQFLDDMEYKVISFSTNLQVNVTPNGLIVTVRSNNSNTIGNIIIEAKHDGLPIKAIVSISKVLGQQDYFLQRNLQISPNPAQNSLKLTLGSKTGLNKLNEIAVFSLKGKLLLNEKYDNSFNISEFVINVDKLIQGVYILKVKSDKGYAIKRFIKN